MNTLKLDSETMQLLDRIRAGADTLMLDGVDSDLAEQAVRELARPELENARLTKLQQDQYRWFLRELTALLRTRDGWDLAFELELLVRKWIGLGLVSGRLQALIRQCYFGLIAPKEKPQITQITQIGSGEEHIESAESAKSADGESGLGFGPGPCPRPVQTEPERASAESAKSAVSDSGSDSASDNGVNLRSSAVSNPEVPNG